VLRLPRGPLMRGHYLRILQCAGLVARREIPGDASTVTG
jgi:hypothetical protein